MALVVSTPADVEAQKIALQENVGVFQHRLVQYKELLQEAQTNENMAFKEITRLQGKITETMVRLARQDAAEQHRLAELTRKIEEQALANEERFCGSGPVAEALTEEENEAQLQENLMLAEQHKESQGRIKGWLATYQKDYQLAEQAWKERSLETAEVRAQIQDLIVERDDDIEAFANGGVQHPENTKPARITEADITTAYHMPPDQTRPALIQSAYPKVTAQLQHQGSPTKHASSPSRNPTTATPSKRDEVVPKLQASKNTAERVGFQVSHDMMPTGLSDDDLLAAFRLLDTDSTGYLTVAQLQSGYFDAQFGSSSTSSRSNGVAAASPASSQLPGTKDFVAKQLKRLPKKAGQPKDTVSFDQFAVLAIKWAAM